METLYLQKTANIKNKHAAQVSTQTGFPSAATHYSEFTIDLHNELIVNQDATFFVRVAGEAYTAYGIQNGDVLIVDRSSIVKPGKLALVIQEGTFKVKCIEKKESDTSYTVWGMITYIIHKV